MTRTPRRYSMIALVALGALVWLSSTHASDEPEEQSPPPTSMPAEQPAAEAEARVVSEPRTPPRLERYEVAPDEQRLDVRRGAFDRQEVRPYGQSSRDRYGKDFPN